MKPFEMSLQQKKKTERRTQLCSRTFCGLICVSQTFTPKTTCTHVHMHTTNSNKSLFIYLFLPQKNNTIYIEFH